MTSKQAVIVLLVVKGRLSVMLCGSHRIARPPEAPVESIVKESHVLHMRWKMMSASSPRHLVSCNIRMSGFSAMMQFRRVRCLDLPFNPLMFQVMTFIFKRGGLSGGIPPRAFGSDPS